MHRSRLSRIHKPLLAWLVLTAAAFLVHAEDQAQPSDRLTVATYNVKNLLDEYDDPYTRDERTAAKPINQIQQITTTVRHLNADVLALQEVENEGFLRKIVEEHLDGFGYRYIVVQPTNSAYGIHLAVLSRRPIISVTGHRFLEMKIPGRSEPRRFARDLLRVTIRPSNKSPQTLDLFVVHFKSKRDAHNDPQSKHWRLAEASTTRGVIENVLFSRPTAWVLLVGDLNDTPSSPVLSQLTGPEENPLMVDLHAHLPLSERVTYLAPPHRSTVDYILASPALAKHATPRSAGVLADPTLLAGSDHGPVFVTFDLP